MSDYVKNALLDASPMRKQKDEAKALVGKWEKTGLLDGLNEDFQKGGMAQLLENQARQLISEAGVSATSPTGGSDEEWSGVALPLVRRIFGEVAAQDFVSVQPMNLPSGLVFFLDFKYGTATSGKTAGGSAFGTTGANTPELNRDGHGEGGLYGVGSNAYSMNQTSSYGLFHISGTAVEADNSVYTTATKSGSISLLQTAANFGYDNILSASVAANSRFAYKTRWLKTDFVDGDYEAIRSWRLESAADLAVNASETQKVSAMNYTDSTYVYIHYVSNDAFADQEDDVVVNYYKQPADTSRGDFESTSGAGMAIPEVDLQLNSQAIVAKTRKLKAVWTPELAQDLNAYHSVDAEAELTSMLSEYISMEIDLEILDMLMADATTVDYWSAKAGQDYNTGTSAFEDGGTFYGTRFEWWQTLGAKIQKVSNEIHRLTLRGGANFVVCSPKVATLLESLPGYNSQGENASQKFAMGVSKIGGIDGRFSIYKNPYMTENQILVGFRGSNFLETGAVYAPYVPLIMTPLVYDPTDFTPRKGVMTRYAKKMIRPEFYAKIHVADLNLI